MKTLISRTFVAFALLISVPFLSYSQTEEAAEEHTAEKKAALESATQWLDLIDNAKYAESWEVAAKLFIANVTLEQWEKGAEGVRAPLGKVISRKVIGGKYLTEMPGAPDGEYVMIQYSTVFENKKEATETVVPLVEDGVWKVSGYHVK